MNQEGRWIFEGGLNLEWPGTYKNAVLASRGTAFWEGCLERIGKAAPNVGIVLIQSERCISESAWLAGRFWKVAIHSVSIYWVPVVCPALCRLMGHDKETSGSLHLKQSLVLRTKKSWLPASKRMHALFF